MVLETIPTLGQMELATEDLSDLGAGIYSVVVTDENGCSVSISRITEPVEMEISETHSDYLDLVFHVTGQQMVLLM